MQKRDRTDLLSMMQDVLGFIAQNAELAGENELVAKIKPLGAALSKVFADADSGDAARETVDEATRWCKLWVHGNGSESVAAKQILGILEGTDAPQKRGVKSHAPPIRFEHTYTASPDSPQPQTHIRFDASETDPDLVDVVFFLNDKEIHRVRGLTEADIMEQFGIAREKDQPPSLSR